MRRLVDMRQWYFNFTCVSVTLGRFVFNLSSFILLEKGLEVRVKVRVFPPVLPSPAKIFFFFPLANRLRAKIRTQSREQEDCIYRHIGHFTAHESGMATGAATDCPARVFAQELGIAGEAFEALKAPDIPIEDGVPKAIKKNWQKWCLRGNHPDKGGDTHAFIAMEARYSAFKDWFQAQRDAPASRAKERSRQRGQAKEDGDKALRSGWKALEGKQYEDAKVFAEEAIQAYEAYKSLQLRRDDDDAQKMVLEATKLKEEAEEQIRVRDLEKRQRDADKVCRCFCYFNEGPMQADI